MAAAVIKDSPGFWWSGWTHVQRIRSEYDRDVARWKSDGPEKMFAAWADENSRFACDTIYKDPVTRKRITEEVFNGQFQIDNNLFERWKQEMLQRILLSGARTAIVLNAVLAVRGAGELHAGSEIKNLEGEEEEW